MLSISAISKAEKNKLSTDSCFLILLEIRLQNTVYICYNNEDVTWKGQLYQAFPFNIGETSEDSDGSDPNVTLKIDNVAQGLQWYVEASGGGVGTLVILRVVNSKNRLFRTHPPSIGPVYEEQLSVCLQGNPVWV